MKINTGLNQTSITKENINLSTLEKNILNETNSFKNALADAQVVSNQGVLQELIEKFEKQEKILLKNPTMYNISEYKKIVKEVLSIASQNYKCEDINVYSGMGYQKNLSLSSIVDEKINSVVEDFMSTNKLSLESISNISDIKGLILDTLA